MKRIRRGYSKNQMHNMGFPEREYLFPSGDGSFTGTLVMKKWINLGLICFFDADDGGKYRLSVWYSRDVNRTHRPAKSNLDISYVEIGTRLRVVYAANSKGNAKWLEAEVLPD